MRVKALSRHRHPLIIPRIHGGIKRRPQSPVFTKPHKTIKPTLLAFQLKPNGVASVLDFRDAIYVFLKIVVSQGFARVRVKYGCFMTT